MQPYKVGILGATGLVGQRLLRCLEGHPWFRVTAVAASERSAGRTYSEAARWRIGGEPPADVASSVVRRCTVDELADCDLVLSGLDASVARDLEPALADDGLAVISNSSAYRMHPDVPLVVPEVNPDHLILIERQRAYRPGYIVTNPNCSTIGLAIAAAPLHRRFGIRRVLVATLQAISGAGIDGPRALELIDNVLPWIPGEEEKLETELSRILGTATVKDGVATASFAVSAACHRVATIDGHLESLSVELDTPASVGEIVESLREFGPEPDGAVLPSAPRRVIEVRDESDRPQPRLDRDAGNGMTVVVGRVRPCSVLGWKMVLLSHNTIRGAAGGTLLIAELLASRGLLPRRSSS